MGSVTIWLDDTARQSASQVAADNGRSLEAELRDLIERTYGAGEVDAHTARIRAMSGEAFVAHLIKTANGATLELPDDPIDEDRHIFGAD